LDWQGAESDDKEREIERGLRSIRAVAVWRFEWTFDLLVGTASDRLAAILLDWQWH
jgi:hypothetical protein